MLRTIIIDATRACNFSCVYCRSMPLDPLSETDENIDTLKRVFLKASTAGISNCFFTGGEFFLHPSWREILELAASHNIRRFVITNGSLITNGDIDFIVSHVQGICLSFHAAAPDLYASIMGCKDPTTQFRVRDVMGELSRRGVPVTLFFSPVHANAHELKPTVEFLQANGKLKLSWINVNRILPVGYGQVAHNSDIALTHDDHQALVMDAFQLKQAGFDIKFEGYPLCFLSGLLQKSLPETSALGMTAKCLMGYHAIAIDYHGRLKVCPCTGQPSKITFFNLHAADLNPESLKTSLGLAASRSPTCRSCDFEEQCGGGCPMARYGNHPAPDPLLEAR